MTTGAASMRPANADQLQAWDGGTGTYWATHADHFDRSVAAYHQRLLDTAAIRRTDQVLDIGCGTGQTTLDAARAANDGGAHGVDLSAAMLDVARRRAAKAALTNASFRQADAQVDRLEPAAGRPFDVAISRTGTMFFADPVAAFANIGRALAPGGRLALIVWQSAAANEWIQEISRALAAGRDLPAPPPDAPGPFSLADPARVRAILGAAGFVDVDLEASNAGMWFGTDAEGACRFVLGFMGWRLDGLDEGARRRAEDELRTAMAAHETPNGVLLGSAAWTIGATRPRS